MKTFRLFILSFSTFLILSCSDSDECTQEDWIGTYTVTAICDGEETTVSVFITSDGINEIKVEYKIPFTTAIFGSVKFDGCTASRSNSNGDYSINVEASLNGDVFIFSKSETIMGKNNNCSINAIRD